MRKLVLIPDTLEYRELSPFTEEEFSELFESYGDVTNAFDSFLRQNDFYLLEELDEEFDSYDVVIATGDPIYSFDNVAVSKVTQNVASIVDRLPKVKPYKLNKCAILNYVSVEDAYEMFMPTSQSWSTVFISDVREKFGVIFVMLDVCQGATEVACNLLKAYIELDVQPDHNEIITSLDITRPIETNAWKPHELVELRDSGLNPVNVVSSDKGYVINVDSITADIRLGYEAWDNLYDAYMLINAVNFSILNFARISKQNFDKFMEFNTSEHHKIKLDNGRLSFYSETLNPHSLEIDFNLNELTLHHSLYVNKFIDC